MEVAVADLHERVEALLALKDDVCARYRFMWAGYSCMAMTPCLFAAP